MSWRETDLRIQETFISDLDSATVSLVALAKSLSLLIKREVELGDLRGPNHPKTCITLCEEETVYLFLSPQHLGQCLTRNKGSRNVVVSE